MEYSGHTLFAVNGHFSKAALPAIATCRKRLP